MIGCVVVAGFPAVIARQAAALTADQPLVLTSEQRGRSVVAAACPLATACGVLPGMGLRRALLQCPAARSIPLVTAEVSQARDELRQVLAHFSPRVGISTAQPDLYAWLDLGRGTPRMARRRAAELLQALNGELQLPAALGIAATRLAARLAALASGAGQATVVTPAQLRTFLAGCTPQLAAELAPMTPLLYALGIRDLAAFADLPAAAIGPQFGPAGLAVWRALHGDEPPFTPLPAPPLLRARRVSDGPVSDRAQIATVGEQLCRRLSERLQQRGRQARTLTLVLHEDTGAVHTLAHTFAQPVSMCPDLTHTALRLLDQARPDSDIGMVEIMLSDLAGRRGEQLALLAEAQPADVPEAVCADLAARGVPLLRAVTEQAGARLVAARVALQPWSD